MQKREVNPFFTKLDQMSRVGSRSWYTWCWPKMSPTYSALSQLIYIIWFHKYESRAKHINLRIGSMIKMLYYISRLFFLDDLVLVIKLHRYPQNKIEVKSCVFSRYHFTSGHTDDLDVFDGQTKLSIDVSWVNEVEPLLVMKKYFDFGPKMHLFYLLFIKIRKMPWKKCGVVILKNK